MDEEEEDGSFHTVKCGLSQFLRPSGLSLDQFERLAQETSHITWWAYAFWHYYLLRQLNSGEQIDLACDHRIAAQLNHGWILLSGDKNAIVDHNPSVETAFEEFQQFCPSEEAFSRTGSTQRACLYMRREFLTSIQNLVTTTFFARHQMWCRLQLVAFCFEQRHKDPYLNDLLFKHMASIRRIAHCVKQLSTMDANDQNLYDDRSSAMKDVISKTLSNPKTKRRQTEEEKNARKRSMDSLFQFAVHLVAKARSGISELGLEIPTPAEEKYDRESRAADKREVKLSKLEDKRDKYEDQMSEAKMDTRRDRSTARWCKVMSEVDSFKEHLDQIRETLEQQISEQKDEKTLEETTQEWCRIMGELDDVQILQNNGSRKRQRERKESTETKAIKRQKLESRLFPITDGKLKKWWKYYLRWLHRILMDVTKWHADLSRWKEEKIISEKEYWHLMKKFHLFTLCPKRRFGVSHVLIDKTCLLKLAQEAKLETKHEGIALFRECFRFDQYERRGKAGYKDIICAGTIRTDGVAVSITLSDVERDQISNSAESKFLKKMKKKAAKKAQTEFRKMDLTNCVVVGVDPNRRDIFVAVNQEKKLQADRFQEKKAKEEKKKARQTEESKEEAIEAPTLKRQRHFTRCQTARFMRGDKATALEKSEYRIVTAKRLAKRETQNTIKGYCKGTGMKDAWSKIWKERIARWQVRHGQDTSKHKMELLDRVNRLIETRPTVLAKRKADKRADDARFFRRLRNLWRKLNQDDRVKAVTRFSMAEYNHERKTRKRTLRREEWYQNEASTKFESKVKVATLSEFTKHLEAVKQVFPELWTIKTQKRERQLDFKAHMDMTSALDLVCQRLIAMNPDKSKRLIIAFGAATFAKSKGGQCPPIQKLLHRLRTCYKDQCTVVMVNEFGTSKFCSNQKCHTSEAEGELKKIYAKDVKGGQSHSIFALKACPACQTIWNRDVNAARNMLAIFLFMQRHQGQRPAPFFDKPKPVESNCGLTHPT